MQATSEQKFAELILYVSLQSEGDEWFGVTKLNKLLFFIDAEALKQAGETITGQDYVKKDHGPVPDRIEQVLRKLEDESALIVRPRLVGGMDRQRRPFALRAPDPELFKSSELYIADRVLAEYRGLTAKQCSNLSHRKFGWDLADQYERIPVSTELISERDLTADEQAYALELAEDPELKAFLSIG